jgi:hypothetical protein
MGPVFILAAGPMRTLATHRLAGLRELLERWTKTKIALSLVLLGIQVEWVLFMARRI